MATGQSPPLNIAVREANRRLEPANTRRLENARLRGLGALAPPAGRVKPTAPVPGRTRKGNVLKQRVMLRGFSAVDCRTAEGREMKRWHAQVLAELGASPTALQRARVDTAVRTRLLLDHLDAYLVSQVTLFPHRKNMPARAKVERRLFTLVGLRQSMADSLDRIAGQLTGKPDPRAAPAFSPDQLLEQIGRRDD